jgi:hypothetical protein
MGGSYGRRQHLRTTHSDVHAAVQGMLSLDDLAPGFADQTQRLALAVRAEVHRGDLDAAP